MKSIQWAPEGMLSGVPGQVMSLLSENGKTFGYGYGPGMSMIFGSARGDIKVEPGQWITRHDDDTITVSDQEGGIS